MQIKPIKTDEEHKAALAEIERLWDAEPNTPDGDRLEVWAILVEAYEQMRWPIPPPSFWGRIWHYLGRRGWL